jgi:hypothetical protein
MAMSRENRLLLIVVAVSAATLLLLARLRFPGEAPAVNPSPAPLERLAARATFDDLASIVAQLQTRVAPALRVLRVRGPALPATPGLAHLFEPPRAAGQPRLVLAWRVRDDRLIAQLGPGDQVDAFVGAEGTPQLLAVDPVRRIGVVSVHAGGAPPVWSEAPPPAIPQYVAVAEATQGGPALRPIFLGRTDPVRDPRWDTPLLALGGAGVTQPGSMIVTLDGRLAGMTVLQENLPLMAPTAALLASVSELEEGRAAAMGDLGVEVADVTPALADATGAAYGAVVAHVRANGPAAGRLQVGDVVTAVGSLPIYDADTFRLEVARRRPGEAVNLSIVRRGAAAAAQLVVATPPTLEKPPPPAALGLTLRNAPEAGAEVLRVDEGGAGEAAGLAAGDLITDFDGAARPAAADIREGFSAAPSGSWLIVGVTRGDAHLVLALQKP